MLRSLQSVGLRSPVCGRLHHYVDTARSLRCVGRVHDWVVIHTLGGYTHTCIADLRLESICAAARRAYEPCYSLPHNMLFIYFSYIAWTFANLRMTDMTRARHCTCMCASMCDFVCPSCMLSSARGMLERCVLGFLYWSEFRACRDRIPVHVYRCGFAFP